MTTIPAQELLFNVILDSQTLTVSAKCLIDYWIFGHRSIHGPWLALLIMKVDVDSFSADDISQEDIFSDFCKV